MLGFAAEHPRHAATTGVDDFHIESQSAQQGRGRVRVGAFGALMVMWQGFDFSLDF